MKKDIVQYKVFCFRLTSDESVPTVVVALGIAEAIDIWLLSHDGDEPYDVRYMCTAYGKC